MITFYVAWKRRELTAMVRERLTMILAKNRALQLKNCVDNLYIQHTLNIFKKINCYWHKQPYHFPTRLFVPISFFLDLNAFEMIRIILRAQWRISLSITNNIFFILIKLWKKEMKLKQTWIVGKATKASNDNGWSRTQAIQNPFPLVKWIGFCLIFKK